MRYTFDFIIGSLIWLLFWFIAVGGLYVATIILAFLLGTVSITKLWF